MEDCERELKEKWDNINYYDGGSLKLSIKHPLEWYVRYASPEHKSIVIVSDYPADNLVSSKSIEAGCNKRKDGRYAAVFTLMDSSQEDVFIAMCSDIIKFSRSDNAENSLKKVVGRYTAWLRLLDHKRNSYLNENGQKGLIGELLFLKEVIESGMNPNDAVEGWIGPDGADWDFVYDDGWHEIKSVEAASLTVSISSLDQLGNSLPGELVVFRIDKCSLAEPEAITLYKAVHKILNMISDDNHLSSRFILKLASAGYIDIEEEYDKQAYECIGKESYRVDETFPRLYRGNISPEICSAHYQLNLPSLNLWLKQRRKDGIR